MAIDNHTFCWFGVISKDIDKTLAFFPEVLGWKVEHVDMGGDKVPMLAGPNGPFGHVRGPAMEGEPSWLNSYLRVEDVDAAVELVTANGGSVVVPANDIPPGRFATVTTASGAYFNLFREASADDNGAADGAIGWVDLHSKDIDKDLAFLKGLGFETSEMAMPNGPYYILNPEGKTQAGAMAGQHAEAPSMWMAWAVTDDADAALGRVGNHGGTVVAPSWDVPGVGRLAIAQDPAGVVFGLLQPPAA